MKNLANVAGMYRSHLSETSKKIDNAVKTYENFNKSKWAAIAFGTISVVALGAIFGGCIPNISILNNFSHLAVQNISRTSLISSAGLSGTLFLTSSANMLRIYSDPNKRKQISSVKEYYNNKKTEQPESLKSKKKPSRRRSSSPISRTPSPSHSDKSLQDLETSIIYIENNQEKRTN
ncbi:MAG: hypothetical protein WCT85_03235 [Parachlamydiales bacterium]|jgi:hypothetical protein